MEIIQVKVCVFFYILIFLFNWKWSFDINYISWAKQINFDKIKKNQIFWFFYSIKNKHHFISYC